MAILFVLGTGRCGTYTLAKILSTIRSVVVVHEGKDYFSAVQRDVGDAMALNIYLNFYSANYLKDWRETFEPQGKAREIMDRVFEKRDALIKECDDKGLHYCEVNRMFYNYTNYIRQRYPRAKFVHMTRNGYNCVRSWLPREGAYPDGFDARAAIHERPFDTDDYNQRELVNYILEKPLPRVDAGLQDAWRTKGRLEKISWFWAFVNRNIFSRLQLFQPDAGRRFRLEDLDQRSVRQLLDFAGIDEACDPAAFGKHDQTPRALDFQWDQASRSLFNFYAADVMQLLDYPVLV